MGYVSTHLSSLDLPESRLFQSEKLLLCSFLYLEVLVSNLHGANHLTAPIKVYKFYKFVNMVCLYLN